MHACVETVPGWDGPGVAHVASSDTDAPDCPSGHLETAVAAQTGFRADAPVCGCDCAGPEDYECEVELDVYTGASCSPTATDATSIFQTGGCVDIPPTSLDWWRLNYTASGSSPCDPRPSTSIPAATFDVAITLCPGSQADCDAEFVCVQEGASPFDEGLCIWREGEEPCPADSSYTERAVYYRGVEDDRSCTDCTCAEPEATCIDGEANFYSSSECSGTPTDTRSDEVVCAVTSDLDTGWATFQADASVTCRAIGGAAQGTAVAIDPITVCCTPSG